jgi:hypothetical protein
MKATQTTSAATSAASSAAVATGESHRIYWQHYHSPTSSSIASRSSNSSSSSSSSNDYITSSAAVRITPAARARDVTDLLRMNLHLMKTTGGDADIDIDHLVLVGTVFSLPKDYVQFEHEPQYQQQQQQQQHHRQSPPRRRRDQQHPPSSPPDSGNSRGRIVTSTANTSTASTSSSNNSNSNTAMMVGSGDPFHLVHTLHPDDSPLQIRDLMMERIQKLLLQSAHFNTRTIISPKLQWFFVPAPVAAAASAESPQRSSNAGDHKNSKQPPTVIANTSRHNIPNCIHLEGYCSSMEEHDDDDDDDENGDFGFDDDNNDESDTDDSGTGSEQQQQQRIGCRTTSKKNEYTHRQYRGGHYDDEEQRDLLARFPWLRPAAGAGRGRKAISTTTSSSSSTMNGGLPSKSSTTTSSSAGIGTATHIESSTLVSSSSSSSPSLEPRSSSGGSALLQQQLERQQQQRQDRRRRRILRTWKRERRRLYEQCISGSNSSINFDTSGNSNNNTLSGFLLKRSKHDPHVWRRVHCVLDNEYLWFVSRLYHFPIINNKNSCYSNINDNKDSTVSLRFAKHGRVRLTRALLLEPSVDYPPLFQTPYGFEVVATDGTSHVFRATTKALQVFWMESISDRILQSFENSLLDNAQLVISDECLARNSRCGAVAVQPLVDIAIAITTRETSKSSNENSSTTVKNHGNSNSKPAVWLLESISSPIQGRHVGTVLRWAMEVSDYREYCRHVQSILPPKSPVVVVSSPSSSLSIMTTNRGRTSSTSLLSPSLSSLQSSSLHPPKLRQSRSLSSVKQNVVPSNNQGAGQGNSNGRVAAAAKVPWGKHQQQQHQHHGYREAKDPFVVDMIQSLWQQASHLLLKAMQVGEDMYPQSTSLSSSSPNNSNSNNGIHHSSHHHTSMETLFRHIDYVITGQRRRCPSKEDEAVKAAVAAAATANATNINGRDGHGNQSVLASSPRQDYHRHEDPPPIDLFDTLLAELQSLAVDTDQHATRLARNVVENGETAMKDGTSSS